MLNFLKLYEKIAFYPNQKFLSEKFILWNVELDEKKHFLRPLGGARESQQWWTQQKQLPAR